MVDLLKNVVQLLKIQKWFAQVVGYVNICDVDVCQNGTVLIAGKLIL